MLLREGMRMNFSPPPQTPLMDDFIMPLGSVLNVFTLPVETLLQGPPMPAEPPGRFDPLIPSQDGPPTQKDLEGRLREEVGRLLEEGMKHREVLYRLAVFPPAVAYHAQLQLKGGMRHAYRSWYMQITKLISAYARSVWTPESRIVHEALLRARDEHVLSREEACLVMLALGNMLLTEARILQPSQQEDGFEAYRISSLSGENANILLSLNESARSLRSSLLRR